MSPQTKKFLYSLVELGLWCGACVLIMDTDRREELIDRVCAYRDQLQYRADVVDTLEQIRALPEE